MLKYGKLFFIIGFLLTAAGVSAQEIDAHGYNDMSLRPVHKYDQMYRKTLWYRLDLSEKQNRAFFASSNEITKIIIEAVKAGIIRPFENDSLKERLSYEKFIENLTVPGSGGTVDDFGGMDDGWGADTGGGDTGGFGDDSGWGSDAADTGGGDAGAGDAGGGDAGFGDGDGAENAAAPEEFFASQLNILEMKEDLIFDKKRSRMIHDIQAITIKIPAKLHPAGLEEVLAAFSYKELVENVFKDNTQAIWWNNTNQAMHLNFSEAFDMRLFSAHLYKYANWDDATIADLYGGEGKAAVIAAKQIGYEMIDFEQDVWEN